MFGVPFLFMAVIVPAALFGEFVARSYSEPLNRVIRSRWHANEAVPAILGIPVNRFPEEPAQG